MTTQALILETLANPALPVLALFLGALAWAIAYLIWDAIKPRKRARRYTRKSPRQARLEARARVTRMSHGWHGYRG